MKWTPLLLLSTLLSACGGSDSETVDNPTPPTPPPTAPAPQISLASEYKVAMTGALTISPTIDVAENAQVSDVEWEQTGGEQVVITTADSDKLAIRAPEVTDTVTTSWQLTVTDTNGSTASTPFEIVIQASMFDSEAASLTVDLQDLTIEISNFDTTPQSEVALIYLNNGTFDMRIMGLRDNNLVEIGALEEPSVNEWLFADVLSKGYEQLLISYDPDSANQQTYYTLIDDITTSQARITTDFEAYGQYDIEDQSGDGINEIYRSVLAHNDTIDYRCESPELNESTLTCSFYELPSWEANETNGYFTPMRRKSNLDDDPALESINETFESQPNEDMSEYEYVVTGLSISKQTSPFTNQKIGEIPLGALSENSKYAVTDFNSDGLKDILRLSPTPNDVFLNTGDLTANFSESVAVEGTLCRGFNSTLIEIDNIDVDGDGFDDLFCENGRWTKVDLIAAGYALVTTPLSFTGVTSVYSSKLIDIDGDGDRDILFRTEDNKNQRKVALNDNVGFASSPILDSLNGNAIYRDFDGDGDLDALVKKENNETGEVTLKIYSNLMVNKS